MGRIHMEPSLSVRFGKEALKGAFFFSLTGVLSANTDIFTRMSDKRMLLVGSDLLKMCLSPIREGVVGPVKLPLYL